MKCLFCKKEISPKKRYCNSNCWNKDHREDMKKAQKKYKENELDKGITVCVECHRLIHKESKNKNLNEVSK